MNALNDLANQKNPDGVYNLVVRNQEDAAFILNAVYRYRNRMCDFYHDLRTDAELAGNEESLAKMQDKELEIEEKYRRFSKELENIIKIILEEESSTKETL